MCHRLEEEKKCSPLISDPGQNSCALLPNNIVWNNVYKIIHAHANTSLFSAARVLTVTRVRESKNKPTLCKFNNVNTAWSPHGGAWVVGGEWGGGVETERYITVITFGVRRGMALCTHYRNHRTRVVEYIILYCYLSVDGI